MKKVYVGGSEPSLVGTVSNLFQAQGHTDVTVFRCGLELYLRICASPPDLLVVEPLLPRVDGLALLRLIKLSEDLRHLPVLVVVSAANAKQELQARAAGAEAFLSASLLDQFVSLLQ